MSERQTIFQKDSNSVLKKLISVSLGLLFILVFANEAFAQNVITLGTGTSVNSTTTAGPVNIWYRSSRMQFVYTASEINTALSPLTGPRDLTKIGWYVQAAPAYSLPNYTIRMKHTSATNVGGGHDSGPYTTVYNVNSYAPTAGRYDSLTLQSPFIWNGSSNILVDVCWDMVTSYNASGQTRYTSTSSGFRYTWSDGSNRCGVATTSVTTYKPHCYMTWMPATAMVYDSSTTQQPNTMVVSRGTNNNDVIRVKVSVHGSLTPLSMTSMTFNTAGTTSTSDISNGKVYYTGYSDVFSTATQFGSTVVSPSGSFTVTGTQAMAYGANYFWLAYDIPGTATVNNVIDGQCNSFILGGVTRTPTVTSPAGNRTIMAPFNGTYTIDPNGSGSSNFTSFGNAISALTLLGITGPTTFNVAAATYSEQVTIPPIPGASATNTVTFDGGTGNAATRIISFNTAAQFSYVVRLNGADYIRLKNLKILATGTTYGYGLHLTNQANYNEIDNCIINVSTTSTNSYCIPVLGGGSQYYYTNGNWSSYNMISNSSIAGGYWGIYFRGQNTSGTGNAYNKFHGNTITDFYYYGFYQYYGRGTELIGNHFEGRSSNVNSYGVMMYYTGYGSKINKNYIKAGRYGMYLYYHNYYGTSPRGQIDNNMIVCSGTSYNYGMYTYRVYYTDIKHNSIHLLTNSTTYGMYLYYGISLDVRNNMIEAKKTSGSNYLFYAYPTSQFSQFDYNSYYSYSTSTTQFYYNGVKSWATLPKTTHNSHSVWGESYFVSDTDLHSRSHFAFQAGIMAGVLDDFDGDVRPNPPATAPCMGADEYPTPPNEYDLEVGGALLDYAINKWSRREDPDEHDVRFTVANIGLKADPTTVDAVYKLGSMPTSSSDGVAETFTPNWTNHVDALTFTQPIGGLTAGGTETVYVRVFLPNEEDVSNDTKSDMQFIDILKVHGNEGFDGFVAPDFTYDLGWLDMPWTVANTNGGNGFVIAASGIGASNGAEYPGDVVPADDWLITPGAALIAGSSYRYDMMVSCTSPQTFEVAFGDSPNPGAMTTFATFTNVNTGGGWTSLTDLAGGIAPYFNTPNIHQNYYVGVHVVSDPGAGAIVFDDWFLDDNPSPPPKIAYGLPGQPIGTFIDDPLVPIIVNASYKAPGLINKTFEVASSTDIYGTCGDMLWDVESTTPWITLTKATPDPTCQGYNMVPARARQFQTFTLTVDPSGLAPGVHIGQLAFYAILFNDDFPPPANGLTATNEIFFVPVELRISNTGTKSGPSSMTYTMTTPMTVPGSPYPFDDPLTGDPIATVSVTSGQIDQMTITMFPNQLPQNLSRMRYVLRYWQIQYVGMGWTADITFPYADHEASMITDRYQLRGVSQPTPPGPWMDPIPGTSSVSDVFNNTVTVHDLNEFNIMGNLALAHPYFLINKDGAEGMPVAFELKQNYPNPFNPTTMIRFGLPEASPVRLVVYNSLGVEVAELMNDELDAGNYAVEFDASDLSTGTYIYRLTAGDFTQTRRMTLSK